MTTIIYQAIIDKKRKNCRIMIRLFDGNPLDIVSSDFQFVA